MSMSEAMDVLDEFGITEKQYPRVMAALELVYEGDGGDEASEPAEAGDDAEQAMADEVFASARNRKAT